MSQFIRIMAAAFALGALLNLADAKADDFDALVSKARTARDAHNFGEAARLLEQAYAIKPLPVILNNLGKAYEELGRYRDAYDAYRQVASNPEAEPELRTLDEARQAKLAPMIGRAWLRLSSSCAIDTVLAGQPPSPLLKDVDRPFDAGLVNLEFRPGDGRVTLRQVMATLGKRLTIEEQVFRGTILQDAVIAFPTDGSVPTSITIGNHQVSANLADVKEIALQAGTYSIEAVYGEGQRILLETTLRPGERIELLSPTDSPVALTTRKAQLSPLQWTGLSAVAAGLVVSGIASHLLLDYQSSAEALESDRQVTQTEAYAERHVLYEQRTQGRWLMGSGVTLAAVGIGLIFWNSEPPSQSEGLGMSFQSGATQLVFRGHLP